MNTWAIGDVHGCYHSLMDLLDAIQFSDSDELWFTGDLVNRGKHSKKVLQFAQKLGSRCKTVLGNHDLYLIAVHHGHKRYEKGDNFSDLLEDDEGAALINWLATQPFLQYDEQQKMLMIHAGLPNWQLSTLFKRHQWLLQKMTNATWLASFMKHSIMGNEPKDWSDDHTTDDRARYMINYFTRIRYCTPSGRIRFDFKGSPKDTTTEYVPWYEKISEVDNDWTVIFGHWSTLEQSMITSPRAVHLDTGCAWNGSLTAWNMIDKRRVKIPANPLDIDRAL